MSNPRLLRLHVPSRFSSLQFRHLHFQQYVILRGNNSPVNIEPLRSCVIYERLHLTRVFVSCCRDISGRVRFAKIVLNAFNLNDIVDSEIYGPSCSICERNRGSNQFSSLLLTRSELDEWLKLLVRSLALSYFRNDVLLARLSLAGDPSAPAAVKCGDLLVPINNSIRCTRNKDTYDFELLDGRFKVQNNVLAVNVSGHLVTSTRAIDQAVQPCSGE